MRVTHFTILGERCSGTNFLEKLISSNFKLELTWNYGYKHFFGFSDYQNSDHVLFIGIVRDVCDWINSFYLQPHHIADELRYNRHLFLNSPIYSYKDLKNVWPNDHGEELLEDRHLETKERYQSIFELRAVKCRFLLKQMPKLVKNYVLIRYEDLSLNPEPVLKQLAHDYRLTRRQEEFQGVTSYKGLDQVEFSRHTQKNYGKGAIWQHPKLNLEMEMMMKYSVPEIKPPPFERVFCINLDRRPDRWRQLLCTLTGSGMLPLAERIPAVDGSRPEFQRSPLITDLGRQHMNGKKGLFKYLTPGGVGCALSHRSVWEKVVREGIRRALVLEDDAELDPEISDRLSQGPWPEEFDLFFLGYIRQPTLTLNGNFKRVNRFFGRAQGVWGFHGYLVSLEGAKKLLKLFPITLQIDSELYNKSRRLGLNIFLLDPKEVLITNTKFDTDVQVQ
jgi:GR25 family glycosyltransferase involved in LPS biosynthesis